MYEIMRRFSSQTHFHVAGMRPALLHASAMTRRLYATRCYGDSLHEWVEIDGTTATVGMTDFSRGFFMIDAVSLQVVVGEVVEANQRIGDMEGSKVMFDVLSPIAGTIMEVNEKLSAGLGSQNEDDLWMMKLDAPNAPVEGLMTRAEFDVCVASVFVREQCSNFRRYSNSHEWVDLYQSAGASPMGMTFDGAMLTGAVRSVTLPQVGERIEAKQVIGKVEG
ncbi:glycine cleavage system H protein, putative, partial [Bodo saltans]